jgi:GAF domain-containing protein
MKAPIPSNEEHRLEALQRYRILDTAAEASYDDITSLAGYICGTPMAFVSLVDTARQWFKSKVGLDLAETSREVAFCAHTILGSDLLEVSDALQDARFADSPLTRPPHAIRFYAGMPLVSPEGASVGALCVADRVPRVLEDGQTKALRALGRQVVCLLEQRRVAADLAQALAEVATLQGLLPICSHCKKIRDEEGHWQELESYLRGHTKADFTHGICPTCANHYFGGNTPQAGGGAFP